MAIAGWWAVTWIAGLAAGLLSFAGALRSQRSAKLEVTFLRALLKLFRRFLTFNLALTLPLWYVAAANINPVASPILGYGGKDRSFEWGFARPCTELFLLGIGLRLELHPALRWLSCFGLFTTTALDAIASYGLDNQILCVNGGRCSLQADTSVTGLRLLQLRELCAMGAATCALVPASHFLLALGHQRNRYPLRRLDEGAYNRVGEMRTAMREARGQLLRRRPRKTASGEGNKGKADLRDVAASPAAQGASSLSTERGAAALGEAARKDYK